MLHNLYKQHARTGTVESQQAMAILKAGKLDCINDSKQKLMSSLNRGGLWSITEPAQNIFVIAEHYFRQLATKVALQGIDIVTITAKVTCDSDVLSNCGLILDACRNQAIQSCHQGCIAWHYDFICTGALILLRKGCD